MPLGFATGLEKCWFDPNINQKLEFAKLVYVGVRDVDDYEKEIILKEKIKCYNVDQTLEFIEQTSDNIHISFDVDALDVNYLDSTGTTASNGLSYKHVRKIIKGCINLKKLIGLDIVELNPELGDINKSLETLELLFK